MYLQSTYKQCNGAERDMVDTIVAAMVAQADQMARPIGALLAYGFEVPEHIARTDTRDLMQRDRVKAAVWERLSDLAQSDEIRKDKVLSEAYKIARFSLKSATVIDEQGNVTLDLSRMTPEEWACIESIELERVRNDGDQLKGEYITRIKKIKTHSKVAMLSKLMDHVMQIEAQTAATIEAARISSTDTVETAGEKYAALLEGKGE